MSRCRASVTRALRRRLWGMHTKGLGAQDDAEQAFDAWKEIIKENKNRQKDKDVPHAPLVEFFYEQAKLRNKD